MTVTVATLGERALRRLGISIVAPANRPALDTRVSPADIATGALIELGVIATGKVPPTQAAVVSVDTIATTALTKLGVIASDETPIASDMTLARAAVDAVHQSLVGQGLVDWTSAQITAATSEEYAGLTAAHLAPSFGKASDPALIPMLEARIATVSRVLRAQNLALAKLQQVQASLTSQAFITWDNTGIPTAVAEEYTRLTAQALMSSFGQKADPALIPALESRVRRMAMILGGPDAAEEAVMSVHNTLAARGLVRWSTYDIPVAAEMPYEMLAANRLAPLFDLKADPASEVLATRTLLQIIALPTSGEITRVDYF